MLFGRIIFKNSLFNKGSIMMKDNFSYSAPEAEIIEIKGVDVITTSLPSDGTETDENLVGPWVPID